MGWKRDTRQNKALLHHIAFHLKPERLRERHVVVFIDDDPEILEAMRRSLRGEPYELRLATLPEEALKCLERENVSAFITDQCMPGITGTELLREVERRSSTTLRILLTAHPNKGCLQAGLTGNLDWLITKPWNDQALRITLRKSLYERERGSGGDRQG